MTSRSLQICREIVKGLKAPWKSSCSSKGHFLLEAQASTDTDEAEDYNSNLMETTQTLLKRLDLTGKQRPASVLLDWVGLLEDDDSVIP